MAEIKETKITDIIQDDRNLNKGTEQGKQMITKSLQKFGAGRSILIDKNNRIIAGNKTHENAQELGMDDVLVVETDGSQLVAVKRTDIDIDTAKGREMALADNATVKVDLQWDDDAMREVSETWGIDTEEWGVELDEKKATELLSELEFTDTYYEPDEKPNLRLKDCIDTELYDKKMQFVESLDLPDEMKETLQKYGYDMGRITIFVDDETDDIEQYREACKGYGCNLHVFNMEEARRRFDYVHRPSKARRSAGQARNMMQDYAKQHGIDFYLVMDDDTTGYERNKIGHRCHNGVATREDFFRQIELTEIFMRKRRIGVWAWLQSGDFIGGENNRLYRPKVMNTTFYLLPYIYRGERGVQDNDTSQFVGILNRGLFTGSYGCGVILHQYQSAIKATRQKKNGGRLHHLINYRYLMPKLLKGDGKVDNIAWDMYNEDWPFSNEPRRRDNNVAG